MEKDELKKEQILDAAMSCLARYGAVKATMDDIAAVIGMKKASLYYYYKNKEAIFSDAIEREAIRLLSEIKSKFKDSQTATEKMYAFSKAIVLFLKDRAELMDLNVQAMLDNHILIQNLHKKLKEKNVDFMADLIKEGMDIGEFSEGDPKRAADAIRTMMEARRLELFLSLQSPRPSSADFKQLEKDTEYLLDLILNGLKIRS
ncbi:MAG: TetR/AcrR family transcriptional regulator [Calditrichaceae bacterium]